MIPGYSIPKAKRHSPGETQFELSPVSYSPQLADEQIGSHQKSPSYTIGQGERIIHNITQTPGVGKYQLKYNAVLKQAPNYHMGTRYQTPFDISQKQYLPDPCSYDPKPILPKAPAFSMGGPVRPMQDRFQSPGPGQYQYNQSSLNNQGTIIGQQKRSNTVMLNRKNDPGPDYYQIEKSKNQESPHGHHFGTQKRNLISDDVSQTQLDMPGPGDYEVNNKSSFSTIGGYIMSRNQEIDQRVQTEANDNPGPGSYDMRNHGSINQNKGSQLGSSNRESIVLNQTSPGPGYYETSNIDAYKGQRSRSINFAHTTAQPITHYPMSPGPCSYDIKMDWGGQGAVKLMGQLMVPQRNNSPGPGIYSPLFDSIKISSPKLSIPKSVKEVNEKSKLSQTPGPGAYVQDWAQVDGIHLQKSPQFTFSRSPKDSNSQLQAPGPGYYDIQSSFVDASNYFYKYMKKDRNDSIKTLKTEN